MYVVWNEIPSRKDTAIQDYVGQERGLAAYSDSRLFFTHLSSKFTDAIPSSQLVVGGNAATNHGKGTEFRKNIARPSFISTNSRATLPHSKGYTRTTTAIPPTTTQVPAYSVYSG